MKLLLLYILGNKMHDYVPLEGKCESVYMPNLFGLFGKWALIRFPFLFKAVLPLSLLAEVKTQ